MARNAGLCNRLRMRTMRLTVFWKKITNSFSLRVFIYLLSAAMVVFGLFNFVFFQYARQTLVDDIIHSGNLIARVLAQTVRLGVFAGDEEQLASPVEAVLSEDGVVEACVLGLDGAVLFRKGRGNKQGKLFLVNPGAPERMALLRQMRESRTAQYVEAADTYEFWSPVLATVEPFSVEALYFREQNHELTGREQVIGFTGITMDKSNLRRGYRDILWRNTVVGVAFLIIGTLVAYLLVQAVTQPLNRLISDIKARGVAVESEDEVGLLTNTFDNLVKKLGESIATINNLKNDLEKKVEERTGELATANAKLADERFQLMKTLLELKETQGQLVHSGKMAALGQLVAGVAHELNNTTNFITSSLPLLERQVKGITEIYDRLSDGAGGNDIPAQLEILRELTDGEEYRKMRANIAVLLANINEGAGRTTKIVRDLKGFSRPDEAAYSAVDIHAGLDSTLTLLEHEYKHHVEIVREYDRTIPMVVCFASQLNQVFMNLLLNAIQAIRSRGKVRIRTWAKAGQLHVAIRDDGGGIAPEVQERIFDPFFSTKEVGDGTGLGLSISYGIIKKHHGEIIVRSKVGEGSEFEVVIPMTQGKNA